MSIPIFLRGLDTEAGPTIVPHPGSASAAFLRGLAKSDEQARAGNLPRAVAVSADDLPVGRGVAVRTAYAITSRDSPAVYLVTITATGNPAEMVITCDCAAGRVPRLCWHIVHVGRALTGSIGSFTLPEIRDHFQIRETP